MLCAVTLCLLCVSALVSGAETSFFSLSHNDIRHLQSRRSASAAAMLRLLANVDLLLATILVVNNLVNICIVILTANIIDSLFTFLRFEAAASAKRPPTGAKYRWTNWPTPWT